MNKYRGKRKTKKKEKKKKNKLTKHEKLMIRKKIEKDY